MMRCPSCHKFILSALLVLCGLVAAPFAHAQESVAGVPPGGRCTPGVDRNGDGKFKTEDGDTIPRLCGGRGYYCRVPSGSVEGNCACAVGEFEMPLSFGGQNAFKTVDVCAWVNSQGSKPLTSYVAILVNIGTVVVVAVGLIMIVISGYFYMTAGGSGERIGKSKTYLGMALAGIILALTAFLVLNTISRQFASEIQEPVFNFSPAPRR